jgi:hypothetical protein
VHPSCQTLGAELRCGQYKYAMSKSTLPPVSTSVIRTIRSPAKSEFRARNAELYGTATSSGRSTVGTHGNQSASLVVAARPSAGRSLARVRNVLRQRKSCCPTAFSSGTLPAMKTGVIVLTRQLRVTGVAWEVARRLGSVVGQSNTKVSRYSISPRGSAASARAVAPKRHLTRRSRGWPKGYAFCPPLT